MKKFLIASAAVLGIVGTASAADLGVRAPIVAPPPVFSWTGIYIGIGGGTGWGEENRTLNQGVIAQGGGFPGVTFGNTFGSQSLSGGFFGGQLGANWQAGWAVFGIQGDAHWADIDGRGSCFNSGGFVGFSFGCDDKVNSFGSVTGRVGAAVDRALIYAKGGWAWAESDVTVTPSGAAILGVGPSSITGFSQSQSRSGWTFGAGVEYAVVPNWSAFVEYNHFDFGSSNSNTVRTLSTPVGTFIVPISTSVTERFDVVKAGVNYKLNWWSARADY